MTARLFNPGPGPFASPAGGVFAPGEHFDGDPSDPRLGKAISRGRILVVDTEDAAPVLPPAGENAKPLEPAPSDEPNPDAAPVEAPKPGPPAHKSSHKPAAKKEE